MEHRDLVVIGTSSGGLAALGTLLPELDRNLPATVLVVQHLYPHAPSRLPELLAPSSALPVRFAVGGERMQPGNVYCAPPDRHLHVDGEHLRLTRGPRENRARPAVDPLFRSAAAAAGSRTIGIILTGDLDDGAAGLRAIAQRGGVTIVEDPVTAAVEGMPTAALTCVEPDYVLPLVRIARTVNDLVGSAAPTPPPLDPSLRRETDIEARVSGTIRAAEQLGELVPLTCPDCGGPLWEVDDDSPQPRFRCHTGHAFGPASLVSGLSDATENALWSALRTMEEKARMLTRMEEDSNSRGLNRSAETLRERAAETQAQADRIRELLTGGAGSPAQHSRRTAAVLDPG